MNYLKRIQLTAQDEHILDVYLCEPEKPITGVVIILHEIFGVTSFITDVMKEWANKGYVTLAPSLYDRLEKNLHFSYDDDGYQKALAHKQRILELTNTEGKSGWDLQLYDIAATLHYAHTTYHAPVNIIGFSWGGTLAYLSACRLSQIHRVSAYYGTHIFQFIHEKPKCAVMLHCGDQDELLTLDQVHAIQKQHPEIITHVYPARHGFHCHYWEKTNHTNKQYYNEAASLESDHKTAIFFSQST